MVGGGVAPDHFFYSMSFGEAAAFLRGLQNKERAEWERTRRVMWAALVPHCKNVKQYADAMPLPWDGEVKTATVEVDEKEVERIRKIAKSIKL